MEAFGAEDLADRVVARDEMFQLVFTFVNISDAHHEVSLAALALIIVSNNFVAVAEGSGTLFAKAGRFFQGVVPFQV